jgi:methionine biosynthesis protein MetW
MKATQKMYESYWKSKKGLEKVEDYERNQVIKEIFKGKGKVLDLACGEGTVSEILQTLGCDVTGLDISQKALEKTKQRGVIAVWGDAEEKLPFKDQSFDAVFWGDNIEHLFLPEKALKEINRILKPGGSLVISCPNMGYWRYRLQYLFSGMIPQTEWYGKDPWEWEHIRFFNFFVLKKLLLGNGFLVMRFFGISRRKLDQPLKSILPSLFGMIMVIETEKK